MLDHGWPLLRAEGFFCNLDILYGGLGIGKLQFDKKNVIFEIAVFDKKKCNFFSAVIFFQFLVIKALDPDWIRIGLQPQTLDPDQMNADPKLCLPPWSIIIYKYTALILQLIKEAKQGNKSSNSMNSLIKELNSQPQLNMCLNKYISH